MSDHEEEALVNRAAAGDRLAVAELLTSQRVRLKKMISCRLDQRLLSRVDPSDVVQETFAIATRELPNYLTSRPMPVFLWLRKLASQRLVDLQRRHIDADRRSVLREEVPRRWNDSTLHGLARGLADREPGPKTEAMKAERCEQLVHALAQLEAPYREILVLHYVEDLRLSEVAVELQLTPETARTRHYRALRKLRHAIRSDSME